MLKIDFHIHTGTDPLDRLTYSNEQLIDKAAILGFDAISITNHRICTNTKSLENYAEEKGILLISGSEIEINNKHILVLNIAQEDIKSIITFDDLRRLKSEKDILVIAPHPYFMLPSCLGRKLEENIDLFDAVEYSFFHTQMINLNRKAIKTARKYSKPLIALSDSHSIDSFGKTYSLIDSEKDFTSIKYAIIKNKINLVSPSLGLTDFIRKLILMILRKEF